MYENLFVRNHEKKLAFLKILPKLASICALTVPRPE
jgi:hypothetical protein